MNVTKIVHKGYFFTVKVTIETENIDILVFSINIQIKDICINDSALILPVRKRCVSEVIRHHMFATTYVWVFARFPLLLLIELYND